MMDFVFSLSHGLTEIVSQNNEPDFIKDMCYFSKVFFIFWKETERSR